MVEFAVTLPIFAALLLAMVDFSNYLNDRTVLTSAAYNGAKAADGRKNGLCPHPGEARKAVRDTTDGLLSVPGDLDVDTQEEGPAKVKRVVVTVEFDRQPSMMSAFTAHLDAFKTIKATGVALCQK